MKTKVQVQDSSLQLRYNRQFIQQQAQGIGALNPVHIEDIIKDRNLDYLQNLGQLIQRTHTNPIWFQQQSSENKMKFLQIYQLSINYARNTQSIYNSILVQQDQQHKKRRQKVQKLKSQILAHKQKTVKLRKQYRKDRLYKQQQKALNYEKSLKKLKNNLIKQREILKAKNDQLFKAQEERRKLQQIQKQKNNMQAFQPPMYPPPFAGYPYYPHYPPQQQGYPGFQEAPNNNNYQNIFGQQFAQNFNQKPNQHLMANQASFKNLQDHSLINNQNLGFQKTFSIVSNNNNKETQKQPKKQEKEKRQGQVQNLRSTPQQQIQSSRAKQSGKSWTLKNSDHVRQSIAESQKNDTVDNLSKVPVPLSKIQGKRSQLGSKISRKQSDMLMSGADMDSLIDVQLRPESQNNLNDPLQKKKNRLGHQTSILQVQKQAQIPIKSIVNESIQSNGDDERSSLGRQQKVNNPIKIKFNHSGLLQSSVQSQKRFGYLQHSNYGKKFNAKQSNSSDKNLLNVVNTGKGIRLKSSDRIGVSATNSMLDTESKNQSRNQQDQYQDDFDQPLEQQSYAGKTRVKVSIQSSQSSPQKPKKPDFVPLLKNYFILKQDAEQNNKSNLHQSKYSSGLGSLKQYSVKFVGSQKRKIPYANHEAGSDFGGELMQMIDMPMDSIIAKPSKLKQSTIRKSTIQNKITKSHDPKIPTQFVFETPKEQNRKQPLEKKDELDDNFAAIKQLDNLKSKKIASKPQNIARIPIPKKPMQKLAIDMAQSHVIEQNVQNVSQILSTQQHNNDDSIDLTVIPECENESYNTQNSTKYKILQLIDKKFEQKGSMQFNKDIIKNQIQSAVKDKKQQYGWQQLTNIFNELAKNKQMQVIKLKQQRKKRNKGIKDTQSRQQSSMQDPSRDNSKNSKNSKKQLNNTKAKQKLNKNQNLPDLQSQITDKDDLTYSRSMLQNPYSQTQKPKQNQIHSINTKKSTQKKQTPSESTDQSSAATKFLRDPNQSKNKAISNAKLLNKITQASKFDKDDEIQNTINTSFPNRLHSVKQDIEESF